MLPCKHQQHSSTDLYTTVTMIFYLTIGVIFHVANSYNATNAVVSNTAVSCCDQCNDQFYSESEEFSLPYIFNVSTYPGGTVKLNFTLPFNLTFICSLDYKLFENQEQCIVYDSDNGFSPVCYNESSCIGTGTVYELQLIGFTQMIPFKMNITINFVFDSCFNHFTLQYGSSTDYQICLLDKALSKELKCQTNEMIESDCTNDANVSYLRFHHCISNDNNSYSFITGYCRANSVFFVDDFLPLSQFLNDTCPDGYTGNLCNKCVNGFYISFIDAIYYPCVNFSFYGVAKLHVYPFLFINVGFLTIQTIVILVMNINFASGSLNGYLFYCQTLTLIFSGSISWFIPSYLLLDLRFPFLDTSVFKSPLSAISFWYFLCFYPFFLLLILWIWLELYDKGYRLVVCLTRPVHQIIARFSHFCNVQPMITHSIASIYTLCFMRIVQASIQLLQFTKWKNIVDKNETGYVSYYDGTVYFGKGHIWYGMMAVIVLLFVIIIPVLFLFLYTFKWFHSLLSFLKLRKEGLMAVCDVFTGAFKHGANNTTDSRMFASYYFLLRFLTVLVLCAVHYLKLVYVLSILACLYCITAGIIMIIRPYKRLIHNVLEFLIIIFVILTVLFGFFAYNSQDSPKNQDSLCKNYNCVISIAFGLIAVLQIPGCFVAFFIIFKICKRLYSSCKSYYIKRRNRSVTDSNNVDEDPLMYDRQVNASANSQYQSISLNASTTTSNIVELTEVTN